MSSDTIVKVVAPGVSAHAGKDAVVNVSVLVKKGYHIQAHKVNDEFIIPTSLDIVENNIIITGKQAFPAGKKFKIEGSENYLLVYDGEFKITIPFKVQEEIPKGKYTLQAKLHYQACDDKTCFAPKTINFDIGVQVI
ncbi:MAG TPA: protein-disulfide reductase DsbD domain-containing protein [Chitinophagaceae bacterium]|jgi:hypothetical protein|nr:protein-disulfide reductase DsbD domain-containing protein [Chitinophagaceae bacterium]